MNKKRELIIQFDNKKGYKMINKLENIYLLLLWQI